MNDLPQSLSTIAVWLSSGVAGVILSLMLERWPVFRKWKSPLKKGVTASIFVLLPLLAQAFSWALSVLDPTIVALVNKLFVVAMSGLAMYSAGQFAHESDPAA